jgi:phosphatidylethanolamine-binding protein
VIDTAKAPTIGVPKALISSTGKGLLIMIDPDVTLAGSKRPYLHWLIPNVDLSNETANVPTTGSNIVPYFQPTPPAADAAHRYTFLLYSQPNNFQISSKPKVLGFDVNAFATASGLGQPKAGSYMLVKNEASKNNGH